MLRSSSPSKIKIFPEHLRRNYKQQKNDSTVVHGTYVRPTFRGPCVSMVKKKMDTSVVIISDFLSNDKEGPSYLAVTRSINKRDRFHVAIGPILRLGQIFGLLPVSGVLEMDASFVKFKWRSWKVLYSMTSITGGFLMVCCCAVRFYSNGVNIDTIATIIFYGSTWLTTILFFRLAPKWPMLCRAIEREEYRSPSQISTKRHTSLKTKFQIWTFVVLFVALIEHLASVTSGAARVYGCNKEHTLVDGYFIWGYPQIFSYTSYALWKAIPIQVYNFMVTFNWTFMDLFIILMSLALVTRFERLNETMRLAKGKNMSEQFWKVTRTEYANLSSLVSLVDANINEFTLLSFANSLYIICMQLFNSFKGIFTTIYFVLSFIFLISRFLAVSISASRIYTNSRTPLKTLFCVSSETYCVEVQRFFDQVTNDVIAFTGMRFFNITRGVLLTIAGTVVTYELVLVQFNQPPPSVRANITLKDNCGGIDSINTSD